MKSLISFILVVCLSCKGIDVGINQAQSIFMKYISLLEKSYEDGQITDVSKIEEAAKFLQEVTGIKSDIDYGDVPLISPSQKNIKDWKKWYAKNKNRLYWDNYEQKVKVKKT